LPPPKNLQFPHRYLKYFLCQAVVNWSTATYFFKAMPL
jgi:hypothetical protein